MKFGKEVILAMANAIAIFANAQEAIAPEDSAVVKLTGENFKGFLQENPLVLAEFFAPWCGHCKRLGPEYATAAEQLKEKGIYLAQIDCTEQEELCAAQGVRSYPSLKVFRNGEPEKGEDYLGGRTSESIVNYMTRQSQPAVTVLEGDSKSEEFKIFFEEASGPILLNGGKSDKMNQTFYDLASQFRNEYTFVQLSDDNSVLSLYLEGEKEPIKYKGEESADVETLSKWIKVESLPFFGEVSPETYTSYIESGLPIGYYFYTTPEQREELEAFFVKLAKEHRGKVAFTGLDASKYGKFADTLNMKQQFPLFVIHNTTANTKFGLDQLDDEEYAALAEPKQLNQKEVAKFVKDVLAGKIEPRVKSEEIPEVQGTNVYKLVGKTHDDIIKDSKKDVLVKYYAPWCGHCRVLAPTYEQLADVYASDEDAKEKVLIADIDATLNDVGGVEIVGFPTIILYPAGEGSAPVNYEANRSLDSLLEFVHEFGTHKVDGGAIYESNKDLFSGAEDEQEEVAEEEASDVEHDEL